MRRFGLIGRTLAHSFSKEYFTRKFEREHLADCVYELYELPRMEDVLSLLKEHPDLEGLNVTIPYKQQVIPLLDEVSFEAQNIGAVNCIRRMKDGRLVGYNTDIEGLRSSLGHLLQGAQPDEALVLGTGGASQAVQYALAEQGIGYQLVSRDEMRGNYTYDNLPVEVVGASRLVINATPVGTWPDVEDAPRIPYAYLTPDHYLLDLVYNPDVTTFLDYGMQRGAHVLNGRMMLEVQAEAAWRIWNE